MFIQSEPKDKIYKQLLDLAFDICDEFVLVIRGDIAVSENAKNVLERLLGNLKYIKEEQFKWPGTQYYGDKPATVYYFKTDDFAKEILLNVANSLHEWVQPNLPEDLSFIKNNEEWLINTAHECLSYIFSNDAEEIEKIVSIDGISIKK